MFYIILSSAETSNIFGIIIMVVIIINSGTRRIISYHDKKIFKTLLWSILIMCAIELISFIVDGPQPIGNPALNRIVNSILYMGNLVAPYLWSSYVYYKIYEDNIKQKKIMQIIIIPVIIMFILGFLNLFTDVLFEILPDNYYHRLPLCYISLILSSIYMILTLAVVIKNRHRVKRYLVTPVICFLVLSIIGIIFQSFFYGISFIWSLSSISAMIAYINLEKETSNIDTLTGLYSRSCMESYLKSETLKQHYPLIFVGIMIDVDKFKSINDTYGHLTGDKALSQVAHILMLSAGKGDFVARLAGDEFVFFTKAYGISQVNSCISQIKENTDKCNNAFNEPYKISLSMGYAIYNEIDNDSIDKFFKRMDINMYKQKSDGTLEK